MKKILQLSTLATSALLVAACGSKRPADAPPPAPAAQAPAAAPAKTVAAAPGKTTAAATTPAAAPAAAPPGPAAAPVAAKAGTDPSGSRMSSADAAAITDHHNKARAAVGTPPLRWSSKLAGYAQEWTDQLAKSCQMKHRTPNKYGENLFKGTAGSYRAVDASKAWESEKKGWRGGVLTSSNWQPVGHFTQMVWSDTTEFGCGEATCGGQIIIACNYDPAGNILGKKPY